MSGSLLGLENIDVSIASGHEGIEAVMGVRRAVYVEELAWREDGGLIDELDAAAVHFVGRYRGQAICSGRMIPDASPFEGECCFDISALRARGSVAEIGRTCVLQDHRYSLASIALFRGYYRYALATNTRFLFVTGASHVDRLYRSLGFEAVAGPKWYPPCQYVAHAYVLDLSIVVSYWRKHRPRMLEQFVQPMDGVG